GQNTFVGSRAGAANTTGFGNSYFGRNAGVASTSVLSQDNTFVGADAGAANTTGNKNVFFGADAGIGNVTGNANTLLGFATRVGSGDLSVATAIGAFAQVDISNAIVLGSAGTNIGIGTTAPAVRLHVVGNTNLIGNVGINTTVDLTRTLTVAGRARISNIPQEASGASVCFNVNGDLLQCGASSLKWKTNVRSFRSGLDIIQQLRPISFNWKEDGRPDIGLGAEEVAKVAPSFTFTDDKGEVTGVKYERLSMLLINAIKEQQAQIERQQKQIEGLKKLECRSRPRTSACR